MIDTSSSSWTFWQLTEFFAPKVFVAIFCGGLIGLERELKNKPAGIKTNILICVGAALYTCVSILISNQNAKSGYVGDPGRLAAQIVSGIGFLGGGAIIQSRGTVVGLTTAATIWIVAAIGVCVGIGHADIAVMTSLTVVVVLVAIGIFEDRLLGRSLSFACQVLVNDPDGKVRASINQSLSQNELVLDDFDMSESGGHNLVTMHYRGNRNDHKKFVLDLWGISGVKEVRQL